jgi:hypothetical protein
MHRRRVVLVRQRIRAVRILGVNRDAEPVGGKEKEERVSEGFRRKETEVRGRWRRRGGFLFFPLIGKKKDRGGREEGSRQNGTGTGRGGKEGGFKKD